MKKIISYSLWGNNPKYTIGAINNVKLAKEIYPGWISRFYIGKSVPNNIVNSLIENDAEIVEMDSEGDWTGMFWRFYPAGEDDVEVMISRDTDSRLSIREKVAVDTWLESGRSFHIMRDHPAHNAYIMGGMWGAKGSILKEIKKMIDEYQKDNFWQIDQNFLAQKIYPIIKDNVCVHDEFFQKIPFPTIRKNYEFVGDVFDENNVRHPEHWKALVK